MTTHVTKIVAAIIVKTLKHVDMLAATMMTRKTWNRMVVKNSLMKKLLCRNSTRIQMQWQSCSRFQQSEEKEKEVRAALEAAMGQFGIKSFENDILKVTYVAPTKKTTIDSKALKKDHPDVYEKYAKTSDVKASVRITVKD